MLPLVPEVSEQQITGGCGSSPKGHHHKLVLFLSSSLDFGDRLLGQLDLWCDLVRCSSLPGFQVAQTDHSSLLNLQAHVVWRSAGLSRNVKSKGEKKLFVCMFHRGRLKDKGLLITWSNCIMVPCAAFFSAGELNLVSIMDGTRVLPHWTAFEQKSQSEWEEWVSLGPRLDPDRGSTSASISGCGIEAEPPHKPVFQKMIRKKLPFCFLATYPRDLNALTSSRDTLGQSIVSDSWTWWDGPPDFSGFGGVLSCCMNSPLRILMLNEILRIGLFLSPFSPLPLSV